MSCYHYSHITDISELAWVVALVSLWLSRKSSKSHHSWTKKKVAPIVQNPKLHKHKNLKIKTSPHCHCSDWQVITEKCSTSTKQWINERRTFTTSPEKADLEDCNFKSLLKGVSVVSGEWPKSLLSSQSFGAGPGLTLMNFWSVASFSNLQSPPAAVK